EGGDRLGDGGREVLDVRLQLDGLVRARGDDAGEAHAVRGAAQHRVVLGLRQAHRGVLRRIPVSVHRTAGDAVDLVAVDGERDAQLDDGQHDAGAAADAVDVRAGLLDAARGERGELVAAGLRHLHETTAGDVPAEGLLDLVLQVRPGGVGQG